MKKLIGLLALAICLIVFGTNLVLAESNDIFIYEITGNNEIVITGVNDKTVTELNIPDKIDGKKVTGIGELAFCDCSELVSVTMEENIKEIGAASFAGCAKLTSVDFADSVEIICDSAFRGCILLEKINFSLNLKEISEQAFYDCENITSLKFPERLEKIGADAFYNCYKITTLNIPASVSEISDGAFSACMGLSKITVASDSLYYVCDEYGVLYNKDKTILLQYPVASIRTSFVIPDSVKEIGSYAFCGAEFLTGELTVPHNVTFIPKNAFLGCARLSKINLHDDITGIDEFAFFACGNLTEILIPQKTEYIGDAAFVGCVKLKHLELPDNLQFIGSQTFSGCTSLLSVDMPENMKTIGLKVFYNCTSLKEIIIPEGVTIIDDDLFYGCISLSKIKLPESVCFIADRAFFGCNQLTEIVLGKNITYIGKKVFDGCGKLEYIYYKGTKDDWEKVKINEDNTNLDNIIYNSVLEPIKAVYEQPYTYTDNGVEKTVPSGVAFATVLENYGEYTLKEFGMLLTDKGLSVEDFKITTKGVVKGMGETKPNAEGKFGIMFYGNGLKYGKTYYTITYAIYKDESGNEITIYGDKITEFSPKEV